MSTVWKVARDLLVEASSRKWLWALFGGMTLILATIAFALRLEVVDGVLAGTRLFGRLMSPEITSADVALRPIFVAAAYLAFYAGGFFMIMAASDFAPSLLAPGRIEHLLALPVKRWQLLIGTFVGVVLLAASAVLFGSLGLVVLLGAKTGVWTLRPMVAAFLATLGFSAIYGVMLLTALFVRSAAVGVATGSLTFVLGIVAGAQDSIAPAFSSGVARSIFVMLVAPLPRLSALARLAADVAQSSTLSMPRALSLVGGTVAFGLAVLFLAVQRFEGSDY